MRANPWAGISALVPLALLMGCSGANSTLPSAAAGSGRPSSATATSPAASGPFGTSAAASGTASGAAAPACTGSDLKATVFGGAAATASVAGEIGFTNTGGTPCRLAGYPAVTGVTAGGGQVSAGHLLSTQLGPDITGVTAVLLAPHAMAVAVVTGNYVGGACGSGSAPTFSRLRVRPPGVAASTAVSALLPALGSYLPDCGTINVTPVAAAASVPQQAGSQ